NSVPVEADALDLPDHVTIDLTDRKAGEHVYAPDVILPEGVNLDLDEEFLVATVDLVVEQDLGEDTDEDASGEVPTVAEENAEKEYRSLAHSTVGSLDPTTGPVLVVGLGNPGDRYAATRHNIGHMVVNELAARNSQRWNVHKAGAAVAEF